MGLLPDSLQPQKYLHVHTTLSVSSSNGRSGGRAMGRVFNVMDWNTFALGARLFSSPRHRGKVGSLVAAVTERLEKSRAYDQHKI
jgi:hypothetical protein